MRTAVKTCASCGRNIEPRKKWSKNWDKIKYCSQKCRSLKITDSYEALILNLLKVRGRGKTICPSEILPISLKSNKSEMELVRSAARRLVAKGEVVILQKGVRVEPSTAKGPIRIGFVKID